MSAWTSRESTDLRRLYADGYSDARIASALGRDRWTVRRWRRKLGLGPAKGVPGGAIRKTRSSEQRAKISAALRRYWAERPDAAEAKAEKAALIRSVDRGRRYAQPARGTVERRWYRQVQETFGTPAARQAWLDGTLEREYRRARKRPLQPVPKSGPERWQWTKLRDEIGLPAARAALLEGV